MNMIATVRECARLACLLAVIQACAPAGNGADAVPPKVFGGAQIQEVYRIRLDRDDLVLESIDAAIKEHNIRDGMVLTGVGSLPECSRRWRSRRPCLPGPHSDASAA